MPGLRLAQVWYVRLPVILSPAVVVTLMTIVKRPFASPRRSIVARKRPACLRTLIFLPLKVIVARLIFTPRGLRSRMSKRRLLTQRFAAGRPSAVATAAASR